jgi:TRAP-type C4-dicarboxylate transport system permease small subunit
MILIVSYILCIIFSYLTYDLGHNYIKIVFKIKKDKLDWYYRQLYLCFIPVVNLIMLLYIIVQLYTNAKNYIKKL